MTREGQNPLKWLDELPAPAPVTVTTVTCIPELHGYWRDSLANLKLCLDSLRANTRQPFDLVILDNGSCSEVRDYLRSLEEDGQLSVLILSHRNLGKEGAWNVLFQATSSDVVSYMDSDVFFFPGWLEESLAVLDTFPEAAMVTAQPIAGDLSQHCAGTLEGARNSNGTSLEEGNDLIPEEYVISRLRSLGKNPEDARHLSARRREVRLSRGETQAFVSASHFQFTSRREVLQELLPLSATRPLEGADPEFDRRLDEAGYWRLSTCGYHVHHLGNRIPDLRQELPWAAPELFPEMGSPPPVTAKETRGLVGRLQSSPRVRRLLKRINRETYRLLHP